MVAILEGLSVVMGPIVLLVGADMKTVFLFSIFLVACGKVPDPSQGSNALRGPACVSKGKFSGCCTGQQGIKECNDEQYACQGNRVLCHDGFTAQSDKCKCF